MLIWIPATVVALYLIRVAIYLIWLYLATEKTNESSGRFIKILDNPACTALFIGDSLTYGTGASTPDNSIAALYSQDHPKCSVYNESINKITTKKLLQIIDQKLNEFEEIDTVVLSIGSNDAIQFRSMADIQKRMTAVLGKLSRKAKAVYVFTPTKPGKSPVLIKSLVYRRLYNFRGIVESIASTKEDIYHIDMWQIGDEILKEPKKYFASDTLHLSDAGQEFWYRELKKNLQS